MNDVAQVQRRTLRVLFASQALGGVGVGAGVSVVGLLAFELAGTASLSGVPATMTTLGAAGASMLIARLAVARGRRSGLVSGYAIGAAGAGLAVVAAIAGAFVLHVVAAAAFGAANAANLQARYAATDLAPPARRASSLSTVVWATTIGAVLGPNLTGPGASVAAVLGLPALAGPYVFAGAAFLGAGAVQLLGLRPDPLRMLREVDAAAREPGAPVVPAGTLRTALHSVRVNPTARAALAAIAAAHATMLGIMVMTPVHMEERGATLQLVGLTISLHIAGMFALSPLVGWAADRIGRRSVLLAGLAQLVAAALLAAERAPTGDPAFQLGLVLLGTGWSFCLIASSALLTEAVPAPERPAVQGASDLVMNLAGGAGGTLAGVVLAVGDFEAVALSALLLLVAPLWLALRLRGPRRGGGQQPPLVGEAPAGG